MKQFIDALPDFAVENLFRSAFDQKTKLPPKATLKTVWGDLTVLECPMPPGVASIMLSQSPFADGFDPQKHCCILKMD